jgi:ABC-type transport system involved in cytochrome bd biosynthesis fused ATPase/permease subunit
LGVAIKVIRLILSNLTPKGKIYWSLALILGLGASCLEVASAAAFSLLTSSLFGGKNSNLGVLSQVLPFAITPAVLISTLGLVFGGKLLFQWIELVFKTKAAGDFYDSGFQKKVRLNEIENVDSTAPQPNIASRMHNLTHNVYYPAGLIISELLIMIFLIPFVIYISPKASLLVIGVTLLLSFPVLVFTRRSVLKLSHSRSIVDKAIDNEVYFDYRIYLDQGRHRLDPQVLTSLNIKASEIDKRIVKLGSYSRLIIELSFIVSVVLTFAFIDRLLPFESRIQFFAVLAYSFFRVIPAFTRIVSARNQISSYQNEYFKLNEIDLKQTVNLNYETVQTFSKSIDLNPITKANEGKYPAMTINVGDKILIKGQTGAGKTTLLKEIGGLGKGHYKVSIDGLDLLPTQVWQPLVALVSQNPFLYGESLMEMVTGKLELSPYEAVLYNDALRICSLVDWNIKRKESLSNEKISGGEKKQIALARAIFSEPEVILLDELTAGMDQNLSEKILRNIVNYNRIKLLVLTSHELILESQFNKEILLD